MTLTKQSTDEEIINYMRRSLDVSNWNERREHVKEIRSREWIVRYLDSSGLIVKSKIKRYKPIEVIETNPEITKTDENND